MRELRNTLYICCPFRSYLGFCQKSGLVISINSQFSLSTHTRTPCLTHTNTYTLVHKYALCTHSYASYATPSISLVRSDQGSAVSRCLPRLVGLLSPYNLPQNKPFLFTQGSLLLPSRRLPMQHGLQEVTLRNQRRVWLMNQRRVRSRCLPPPSWTSFTLVAPTQELTGDSPGKRKAHADLVAAHAKFKEAEDDEVGWFKLYPFKLYFLKQVMQK